MKEIVKPIILSHKRPDKVATKKVLPQGSFLLCVPEGQAPAYEQHNPGIELLVHPDTVVGLVPKLKWVYERYPNVAYLDDDIARVNRTYIDKTFGMPAALDPEAFWEVIQSTAFTAREAGIKLFGYATNPNPVNYNAMHPLKLTGYVIGGCRGVLEGFKMEHIPDKCTSATDYFMSGINAYFERMCLVDNRFAIATTEGTFVQKGGTADHRSIETERRDFALLKEYFGEAIRKKKKSAVRTKKGIMHDYERSLIVPF